MSKKPRPNALCPCGSGAKYKKCCGAAGGKQPPAQLPHSREERAAALEQLTFFIEELWEEEDEEAHELFWGRFIDREEELTGPMAAMSSDAYDAWLAFDYRLPDDRRIIDHFLEQAPLNPRQRSFLQALAASRMTLYEVEDAIPGVSITLRELFDGSKVRVNERSASRQLSRGDCVAARVIPRGTSGGPEIEHGLLTISNLIRGRVQEAAAEHLQRRTTELGREGAARAYEELPPLFHEAWLTSIFDPPVPELRNNDDERMVLTRVLFAVTDCEAVERALGAATDEGVARSMDGVWSWSGPAANGEVVSLATLTLRKERLVVEANSAELLVKTGQPREVSTGQGAPLDASIVASAGTSARTRSANARRSAGGNARNASRSSAGVTQEA